MKHARARVEGNRTAHAALCTHMRPCVVRFLAKEKVVGWYHTGPKLRSSDLAINEVVKRYAHNSVLVIVDVKPADLGLPTNAYYAVEEIRDVRVCGLCALGCEGPIRPDRSTLRRYVFHRPGRDADDQDVQSCAHRNSRGGGGGNRCGAPAARRQGQWCACPCAHQAAPTMRLNGRGRVGFTHAAAGSLSTRITDQLNGLRGLQTRLLDIHAYLEKVADRRQAWLSEGVVKQDGGVVCAVKAGRGRGWCSKSRTGAWFAQ